MKKIVFIVLISLWQFADAANTPILDGLSDDDFKNVSKDFSGMFVHTSATPPTSLGKIFGVEAAAIVGAAEVPGVEEISKRYDSNSKIPYAPFAFLYGAISVPYGITIETNLLPQVTVSGLTLQHYGAALKWSLLDHLLPNLPFDLAVKTFYSRSELSFTQTIPSPSTTVDVGFKNAMFGAEALFGISLPLLQPYVGAGYVTSNSELTGIAQADPSFSMYADNLSQSKKNTVGSLRLIAGCQFNLTLLKLSVEYNRVFDNNRIAAKVGLSF